MKLIRLNRPINYLKALNHKVFYNGDKLYEAKSSDTKVTMDIVPLINTSTTYILIARSIVKASYS